MLMAKHLMPGQFMSLSEWEPRGYKRQNSLHQMELLMIILGMRSH